MKHGTIIRIVAASLGLVLFAGKAHARNKREGFNFGTTVRVLDSTERNGGTDHERKSKTESSGQLINPYVGYAFGSLNLGLVFMSETANTTTSETQEDGITNTTRKSDQQGRGLSLFARFLFGGVFFFEGGGGVYQNTLHVHTESKVPQGDGAFTGNEDDYEIKGIGPGYHAGAGLELPISNGFYFTTAYQARIVQLRDRIDSETLGKKKSTTQKREILFGVAYYDK